MLKASGPRALTCSRSLVEAESLAPYGGFWDRRLNNLAHPVWLPNWWLQSSVRNFLMGPENQKMFGRFTLQAPKVDNRITGFIIPVSSSHLQARRRIIRYESVWYLSIISNAFSRPRLPFYQRSQTSSSESSHLWYLFIHLSTKNEPSHSLIRAPRLPYQEKKSPRYTPWVTLLSISPGGILCVKPSGRILHMSWSWTVGRLGLFRVSSRWWGW